MPPGVSNLTRLELPCFRPSRYLPSGDTPLDAVNLLENRQRLVKESDFSMAEKRAIAQEERLNLHIAEQEVR